MLSLLCAFAAHAQRQELNSGWKFARAAAIPASGEDISKIQFPLNKWLPATIPGTVLTSLLNNNQIPDPFYGMNNNRIPDIYDTGRGYYTYWFATDFEEHTRKGENIWLELRGVNNSCDIYLNVPSCKQAFVQEHVPAD